MILVFGGAYQGKRDFVKSKWNIGDGEIFDCRLLNLEEVDGQRCYKAIDNLHLWVFNNIKEGETPSEKIKDFLDFFKDKIIITDDISMGLVPIDRDERFWREENGRVTTLIARKSEEVYRVFCGIETRLK